MLYFAHQNFRCRTTLNDPGVVNKKNNHGIKYTSFDDSLKLLLMNIGDMFSQYYILNRIHITVRSNA